MSPHESLAKPPQPKGSSRPTDVQAWQSRAENTSLNRARAMFTLCVTVAKSCSCPRRSLDPPEYFTGCTVSSPRQIPNRAGGLVAAREFGRRSAFSPIPADLRPRCSRSAAISVFAYILLTGDRGFESISLQQRVSLSAASAFEGREPRLSARVWAAGLATRSAETRRAFQFAPTCGNISVGPYSSTAVPLMWSARIRRRSQRSRAFRGLMCGRSLNSDRAQAKPSTVR